MNSKIIIAGIIAGVVSFLLGWVIYGMLLMDYYDGAMVHYEGLQKENMNMVAMIIAQLAGGLLLSYIIGNFSGTMGMQRGAMIGAVVGFLWALQLDMFFVAQMNMFANNTGVIVDVLINTLFYAILGAVIGWWLSRGAKA